MKSHFLLFLITVFLFSCEQKLQNNISSTDTIIKPLIDSVPIPPTSSTPIQASKETIIYPANCRCDSLPNLNEFISCDPICFDNKAKLTRNFNCDSSWLTFENAKGNKLQIYSLHKELTGLTHKLGYVYFTEYETTFLAENRVASGCCYPNDFYLHDKNTGELIKYLGRAVYVSEDKNSPFVISITNNNYKDEDTSEPDYNSLTVYNLETRKEFKISLPAGDIDKGMNNNHFRYPEELIEAEIIGKHTILIKYYTDEYKGNKSIVYKVVKVDLRKYK